MGRVRLRIRARVKEIVYFALSRMFTMLFKHPLAWVTTSSVLCPPLDFVIVPPLGFMSSDFAMIVTKRLKIGSDLGTTSA